MIRRFLARLLPGRVTGGMTLGRRGERLAASKLKRDGYTILARNLTTRWGEVDLVALAPDGRTVVIVEVKTSGAEDSQLPPETHVTPAKQRKLVQLACQVARQYRLTDRPIRFDVVGVVLVPGQAPVVRHHPGAFESHV